MPEDEESSEEEEKPNLRFNNKKVAQAGMWMQHFLRYTTLLQNIDTYAVYSNSGHFEYILYWYANLNQLFSNIITLMLDANLLKNIKDKTTLTAEQERFTPYIDEIQTDMDNAITYYNQANALKDTDDETNNYKGKLMKESIRLFNHINLMLNCAIQEVGLGIGQKSVYTQKEIAKKRIVNY